MKKVSIYAEQFEQQNIWVSTQHDLYLSKLTESTADDLKDNYIKQLYQRYATKEGLSHVRIGKIKDVVSGDKDGIFYRCDGKNYFVEVSAFDAH